MTVRSNEASLAGCVRRFAGLKIDLTVPDDLARWCHILDCSLAELRCAVQTVGPDAAEVCLFIAYLNSDERPAP